MNVEILVYLYLTVCVAMIIFNIGTINSSRRRERINERKRVYYDAQISEEMEHISNGQHVSDTHIRRIRRVLKKPQNLLVFREVVIQKYHESPDLIKAYISDVYDALASLTPHYTKKRKPINYAFILEIIKELIVISGETHDATGEILIRAVYMPNTYCRENALEAIYATGKEDLVLRALEIIDSTGIKHGRKLLIDGLMQFRGDKIALLDLLWEHLNSFEPRMQDVILNFSRFSSSSHRDEFFAILTDPKKDPELRFSSIRYFGRYPDDEAYPVLLDMAQDLDNPRWEYPAIACTALASYPGEQTVAALKNALFVRDWYVRYNAAESLAKLGVDHNDTLEIIHGEDRYAREILQFMLDVRNNRMKEVNA